MKSRLPQGYGGGPSNMQSMMKQAQKMQEDMAALQEELDAKEYEVKAGGGVATVRINGKKEILSLDLAPEIVDPDDIETLSDIIIAGVNQAIKTVEDENAKAMSAITGSMSLPGLF
ncbi:MAG: YbaB/EbfC family nucleoid-associated protein [Clostridia bacterium]|nr:YbaB/EbfC family nucleoid-associated protein [Clostridia bacterium]